MLWRCGFQRPIIPLQRACSLCGLQRRHHRLSAPSRHRPQEQNPQSSSPPSQTCPNSSNPPPHHKSTQQTASRLHRMHSGYTLPTKFMVKGIAKEQDALQGDVSVGLGNHECTWPYQKCGHYQLGKLVTLHGLAKDSQVLQDCGYFKAGKGGEIKRITGVLRPQFISLIEGFDISGNTLNSAIGSQYGDIYEQVIYYQPCVFVKIQQDFHRLFIDKS